MYCKIVESKLDGLLKERRECTRIIESNEVIIGCIDDSGYEVHIYGSDKTLNYTSRTYQPEENEEVLVAAIYLINDSGQTIDSYKY